MKLKIASKKQIVRAASRAAMNQYPAVAPPGSLAMKLFDPNQPRWPAGQSIGGRWRRVHEGDLTVAIGFDRRREAECEKQQALDWDLCRMSKSRLCWESAMTRYAACMTNDFIPDLLH